MKVDFDPIQELSDPVAGIANVPLPPPPAIPLGSSPTRRRVAKRRAWALAGAWVYECVWVICLNKREDLSTLPWPTLIAEVTIPLAAAALAFAAATARGRRGLGTAPARLIACALLAPALFAAATAFAGPADIDRESFWPHALRCFLVTVALGIGPLALAAWSFRHAFVAAPAWRMAALGIAGSAFAAAAMSIVCSVGNPAHVLVGHGGLILVAAAAGALFGRRLGAA